MVSGIALNTRNSLSNAFALCFSQLEKSKFRLTLKELIEKRKMFAKVKAQASYKIVKAWRQNKIKSKK